MGRRAAEVVALGGGAVVAAGAGIADHPVPAKGDRGRAQVGMAVRRRRSRLQPAGEGAHRQAGDAAARLAPVALGRLGLGGVSARGVPGHLVLVGPPLVGSPRPRLGRGRAGWSRRGGAHRCWRRGPGPRPHLRTAGPAPPGPRGGRGDGRRVAGRPAPPRSSRPGAPAPRSSQGRSAGRRGSPQSRAVRPDLASELAPEEPVAEPCPPPRAGWPGKLLPRADSPSASPRRWLLRLLLNV